MFHQLYISVIKSKNNHDKYTNICLSAFTILKIIKKYNEDINNNNLKVFMQKIRCRINYNIKNHFICF